MSLEQPCLAGTEGAVIGGGLGFLGMFGGRGGGVEERLHKGYLRVMQELYEGLGTMLGVPIVRTIRTIVFWVLYWGSLILGNYKKRIRDAESDALSCPAVFLQRQPCQ